MQLSYRGEGFLGWQVQPQGITVQGTLQDALSRLLHCTVEVTGAGRTDTGVNARMMIAHFDAPDELPTDLMYRLNAMIGHNIAIQRIWAVTDNAHARFDAIQRTYRYYVCTDKSPFLWQLSWRAVHPLDFKAMNQAAQYLLGKQDFTSFSKLHTQTKTNICTINYAKWVQQADNVWYFEISADRFLRNMVRAIVGTLVDVGRGKMHPEEIASIIKRKNRCSAGTSMPGYALYLWDIKY